MRIELAHRGDLSIPSVQRSVSRTDTGWSLDRPEWSFSLRSSHTCQCLKDKLVIGSRTGGLAGTEHEPFCCPLPQKYQPVSCVKFNLKCILTFAVLVSATAVHCRAKKSFKTTARPPHSTRARRLIIRGRPRGRVDGVCYGLNGSGISSSAGSLTTAARPCHSTPAICPSLEDGAGLMSVKKVSISDRPPLWPSTRSFDTSATLVSTLLDSPPSAVLENAVIWGIICKPEICTLHQTTS